MDASPDEEEGFGTAMQIGSETTEAEREFGKVLMDLREMEGLKLYSDVYTKLYDSYFKLKEDTGKLTDEIDTLKVRLKRFDDIVANYTSELNDANKTIDNLRAEIETARALADAMHARELASVEALETIKKTVARLEKELDARKRAGDDDTGATSAAKLKEEFEKEKLRMQGELDGIKNRLANALNYQEDLEQRNTDAEDKISKLEEQLEEADNNAVRTNRLVEHMKGEINTLKSEIEARGVQIGVLNDKVSKTEKSVQRREKQLREMETKLAAAQNESEAANMRAMHLRESLDNTTKEYDKAKQTLVNTTKELKNRTDEGTQLRNTITKLSKQTAQQTKRYELLEQAKTNVESERDRLRQAVAIMEREISLNKKQAEADRRDIENLGREKEILYKNMQKVQNDAMENLQMLNLQEQRRKQLETELENNAVQLNKQRLIIRSMEKDKDRMLEETIALNEKIDETMEEVRLRTADILDLKKALREQTLRGRQLETSLDAARAERNMLHKNYTESLDEIQDLKEKFKMLAYQIEQLKEDISSKETGLKSCQAALVKCQKRVEQLRGEVQAGQNKLGEARAEISALGQEIARLNRIIHEGDAARHKLSKQLEGLGGERDVLGAQLVRRADELALLYEKIRLLEGTLHRGERQYDQRVDDIRLLRLEILRLRKEKNLLSKGIENMTDLRLEVFNLERELARERLRVRALEQSVQTPLNVHRWRKLHATDPDGVHLTQKLRLLQKKVLTQSETLVLKDRELKETQNLYKAVKDMLAVQPSPEIQQTLNRTQRALTQRTSKMKCLIAELSMRERQVADMKLELQRAEEFKHRYEDIVRALDAEEQRRLLVPETAPAAEEQ